MMDIDDYQGARYRLAREYADQVNKMMKAIERDPEGDALPYGLAINAAWEKFCKADQEYCAARKREEASGNEG